MSDITARVMFGCKTYFDTKLAMKCNVDVDIKLVVALSL